MKAVEVIIVFVLLCITSSANSQFNKTGEHKKIELTISSGKEKLHKVYSNFKEIQDDESIKKLGIDIDDFIVYESGVIQVKSISSTLISIYNIPVSKELEFTKKYSDKGEVKIKIKLID